MNIQEIRQQYPQYNDMDDAQLANALHTKYYNDMPFEQFSAKIGLQNAPKPASNKPVSNLPESRPASNLNEDVHPIDKGLIGLGRAFVDIGESGKQLGLQAAEKLGLAQKGATKKFTQEADEERNFYENTPVGQSGLAQTTRLLGNVAPYTLVPGGVAGGLAKRMLTGGLAGAATGFGQYVPEGNSRTLNTAIGGAAGGLLPAAIAGVTTAGGKLYNAAKGNVGDDAAKAVIELGKKWDVPVSAADASNSRFIKGMDRVSEEMPPGLSTRGFRQNQMNKAQGAAERFTTQLEDEMLSTNYGGKDIVNRLKKIATGDSPRSKAAQGILEQMDNAGGDWQKIIETSGNSKLLRSKIIADRKSDRLTQLADQYGVVPLTNTQKALDDMIAQAEQAVIKNKPVIDKLQEIKSRLGEMGNINYSQARGFRSDLGDEVSDFYTGGNAVIGKKGVGFLQNVKTQLEKDMKSFATQNGPELNAAWKNFDNFYKAAVVPYKDAQLAKALTSGSPDEIYSKFVTRGTREGGKGTSRAERFYNALDDKGKSAVRYGMASEAFEKAVDTERGIFSPATFAGEFDRIAAAKGVFFKGQAKAEADGFKNLMRHVERSKQALDKPETGVRTLPYLIAGGLGYGASLSPGTAAASVAGAAGLKLLMTTTAGRNLLLSSSKIKPGTPAMQKVIDSANRLIQRSAATAPIANSNEGESE